MARYPGLMRRMLANDHPAMEPGRAQLETLIDLTGSISAAAREIGMSYRRVWQLVDALNAGFKRPVVMTAIGGKCGSGAVVAESGRAIPQHGRQGVGGDRRQYQCVQYASAPAFGKDFRK